MMIKIEKLLEETAKIICIVCYAIFLVLGLLIVMSVDDSFLLNLFFVIFGGLIMFAPYFLMCDKFFYDYLVNRFSKFKISYIKYLLILVVVIVPIFYRLIELLRTFDVRSC